MKVKKCCKCGRFVGIKFAGYQNDRTTDRGELWCEGCLDANAIIDKSRSRETESLPI